MPIEITKLELNLNIPSSIRFADVAVSFDLGTRKIQFNRQVMRQVLEASGMESVDGDALPPEITDAIIALWYQHARAQGQPEDPHMERFLFNRVGLEDSAAAHTIH